ncbi:type VI secretion system tube protein Hcp [Singulisphaera sp. Ch08]|uniref:Type VI secretion system tube protein Hcp n=1 Tax=Singulisphaera sp. Ch08 TaxID=3120278 RepID=A0AAU7C8K4_9BACT
MAVDMFLKITDVKGESKDKGHAGEIEIESFSWGASQLGASSHGTGAGAGKVSMNDFHFVMRNNSASPNLFLFCANGKHLKEAKLTCRKAGGTQQNFMIVTLSDVLVSSYQTGGSQGGEVPMDQISLNYSKVELDYLAQDEKGITKSAGKKHWDMKTNTGG